MEGKTRYIVLFCLFIIIIAERMKMVDLAAVGLLVLFIAIIERIFRNIGAAIARNGLTSLSYHAKRKDPEKLAYLQDGNLLGMGHYKIGLFAGFGGGTCSGVLIIDRKKMKAVVCIPRIYSVKINETDLTYDDIDLEKSYYKQSKKWIIFYLKNDKRKYFLRKVKQTDDGLIEEFVERCGVRVK